MRRARSAAAGSNPELSARDLGQKVSILYSIEDADYPFSEAVGLLQRIDETDGGPVYSIAKRNGTVVEVPASQIVKLKRMSSP